MKISFLIAQAFLLLIFLFVTQIAQSQSGQTLHFDGQDDFIKIDLGSNFGPSIYTIEMWVKFEGDPSNQNIFVLTDENGLEESFTHQIRVNNDGYFEHATRELSTNLNRRLTHIIKPNADIWYHVEIVANSGGNGLPNFVAMSVNGNSLTQNEISNDFGGTVAGSIIYIGHPSCGHDSFRGQISDLRIWDIQTNTMNIEHLNPSTSGLAYYYNFNEGVASGNNVNVISMANLQSSSNGLPVANLFNFALNGEASNWLACDGFSSPIILEEELVDQEVEHGQSAFFSSAVAFATNPIYQWYKNNEPIIGATKSSLPIPNASFEDEGSYYLGVQADNECPTFSPPAELVIRGTGEVLNFDGENDYVQIRTGVTNEYSIETWVKFEGDASNRNIFTGTNSEGALIYNNIRLETDQDGGLRLSAINGSGNRSTVIVIYPDLQPDTWYHLALVYNQLGKMKLYINGVLWPNGEPSIPGHVSSPILNIGSPAANGNLNPFKGEMDEFRVWHSARTQQEINANMNQEISNIPDELIHYFKFNRGVANENNSQPKVDFIPDFGNHDVTFFKGISMHHFDFQGPESNWSDCSPVSFPVASLHASIPSLLPIEGEEMILNVQTDNTFSNYNYQWSGNLFLANYPENSSDSIIIEDFGNEHLGDYRVTIGNGCPLENFDTLELSIPVLGCLPIANAILINYPVQKSYTGCTNPASCIPLQSSITTEIRKGYCDSDQNYPGGELVYTLNITSNSIVNLKLTELSSDVDMFLYSNCDLDYCIGSSTQNVLKDEAITVSLTPATYYLIIDSKEEIGADHFVLDVELLNSKCDFANPIECGESIFGDTENGTSLIQNYCSTLPVYSGNESIYSFSVIQTQTIVIDVKNISSNLDVFLLNSLCEESNCLASSTKQGLTDEKIIKVLPAGNYFIVVDGSSESTSTFDLSIDCLENFSASQLDNDAYIDLQWNLDKESCTPLDTGIIVKLIDELGTTLFEQEFTIASLVPDVIAGSFRHYLGPDQSRNYVIRVFNRLSNQIICHIFEGGSTLPFQVPELLNISAGENPDSIRVTWRNHSKLSDQIRIIREGQQIANLTDGLTEDSLITTFVDYHGLSTEFNLQNHQTYVYCIETYSDIFDQTYQQQCGPGFPYRANFQATDGILTDEVLLSWSDLSPFVTSLIVRRDGVDYATIDPSEISFRDVSPIYGKVTDYALALFLGDDELIVVSDDGHAPKNGSISGKVLTNEGNYPVKNVNLQLYKDTTIQGNNTAVLIASTISNFNGEYSFENIYYGLNNDFTVKIEQTTTTFVEEELAVNLNGAIAKQKNINFLALSGFNFQDQAILIDTFSSVPMVNEDAVILNWNYTYNLNDTVFFYVFRGGELIGQINDAAGKIDSLIDITGIPGTEYLYTLQAFSISNNIISHQDLFTNEIFPEILAPQNVSVTTNIDPKITINWDLHPSPEIDGIYIYRNGILIGESAPSTTSFIDTLASPGSSVTYTLQAFKTINQIEYPSLFSSAQTSFAIVPNLASISNLVVTQGFDEIELSWFVPSIYTNDYRFDGIIISRKKENSSEFQNLAIIDKDFVIANSQMNYIDRSGIPNAIDEYRVDAYLSLTDSIHKTGLNTFVNFPFITTPANFSAQEDFGKIILNWDPTPSQNIQGWLLVIKKLVANQSPDSIYLEPYKNQYKHFVNNPEYDDFSGTYISRNYSYSLQAFREIEHANYYSGNSEITTAPLSTNPVLEPIPVHVLATDNLINHIKLCWDWTAAKQSDFIILREGIILDTLPPAARAYYDYDAPNDPSVEYGILSLNNNQQSATVYAAGRIASLTHLRGRVYNDITKSGLPGIAISAKDLNTGQIYRSTTLTDSTGHYSFENLPLVANLEIELLAEGLNVDFDAGPNIAPSALDTALLIDISNNSKFDFIDYSIDALGTEVTSIIAVDAIQNPLDLNVQIIWSPSDTNYSGFEIYRLNKKIGDVKKGNPFEFFDAGGFPGFSYAYGVKAYWNTEFGRKYSEIKRAFVEFPKIFPVENLTATPYYDDNLMLISWSHPLDNVDGYRVRRNGEFAAFIPSGQQMMWYDSTGIPGLDYQYEVTAIKNPLASDPIEVNARYKGVSEVMHLQSNVIHSVVCGNVISSENHTFISWEYADNAAQGFEIYRDGRLIAEIDSNHLAYAEQPNVRADLAFGNGSYFYKDFKGSPELNHVYHITPFITRKGMRYGSGIEELVPTTEAIFPRLSEVKNFELNSNEILGTIDLSFEFGTNIVRGFRILRDLIPIDTIIAGDSLMYHYSDFTGAPGITYSYAIQPFDIRNGIVYSGGSGCIELATYPSVPTPQNLVASQGDFESHIKIKWDFEAMSFVDSFILENLTTGQIFFLRGGRRNHIEIVTSDEYDEFEYRIKARRMANSQILDSEWSNKASGYSAGQMNGSGENDLIGDCNSNRVGTSVVIKGNWAVSGMIEGEEAINIYQRVSGRWQFYEKITSPLPLQDIDFGFSIDLENDRIAVGAPKLSVVYIYSWNGQGWGQPVKLLNPPGGGSSESDRFGHVVALENNHLFISAPLYTPFSESHGRILRFTETNGQWAWTTTIGNGSNSWFGYSMDVHGDYIVAARKLAASNVAGAGEVIVNKYNNGVYESTTFLTPTFNTLPAFGLPSNSISISENYMAMGNPYAFSEEGQVLTFKKDFQNNFVYTSSISPTELNSGDRYGTSVSVREIPSPFDNHAYLLAGAPFREVDGLPVAGKSYIFKNNGLSFYSFLELPALTPDDYSEFGTTAALSEDALIIGSPLRTAYGRGSVELRNLIKAPSSVIASDGESFNNDPTKTTIRWQFVGATDMVFGFNIYRGDELLTFRNVQTGTFIGNNTLEFEWDDNSGHPGQSYVYSVKTFNSELNFESPGTADAGFNTANGIIQGSVLTQVGSVPVPGVTIKARGVVKDEIYTYETTTLPNGNYIFNEVFYDGDPLIATQYEVNAFFEAHDIQALNTNIGILNSLNDPTQTAINFIDRTAYVIKGKVTQPNVRCPLAGVKIEQVINGSVQSGAESLTDEEGNYTIVVNPNQNGLNQLKIRINHSVVVDDQETIYHFVPDADTVFNDFTNFPLVTELNFEDDLTYQVSIKVKNTCLDPISTGNWDIRIRTLDGCFDEIYQTNSSGDLLVDLLPFNYNIKVVGVDDLNGPNQQAIDFFANFPVNINLLDLHRDSSDFLSPSEIELQAARIMTYHKAPNISVNGFTEFFCNSDVAVISQGEEYSLDFQIGEVHGASNCEVQEGFLTITNPAAEGGLPINIFYNKITESFPPYTFIAGNPNQINPHIYAVTFDYKSDDGNFLGRVTKAIFVEGQIGVPGTDIIVDASNGNATVPYPLMVLRDPPGDGSSSYIESNQTFNFTSTLSMEENQSASISASFTKEFFGIGTSFSADFEGSRTNEKSIEIQNSVTTTSRISTSDDIFNIGRNGDIMVGAGLVMQFGIVEEYSIGNCDTIQKTTSYAIAPDKIKTTWSYTIAQIEDIIQGYLNDSIKVQNGSLNIVRGADTLSKTDAITFVSSNLDNWRSVLHFHDVETVPYYMLCTMKPKGLSPAQQKELDIWQAQLRPYFVHLVGNKYVIKDDIEWNQTLYNLYNAAGISIRKIIQNQNLEQYKFPYIGDELNVNLLLPIPNFLNVDFPSILNLPAVQSFQQNYGPQIENITTGGSVTTERSITNVQAGSTTIGNSIFLSKELGLAFKKGKEVNTLVAGGIGAIIGVVESAFKFELELGSKLKWESTRSNQIDIENEESVEVGYTLFDDDGIDQFSVAVIQGADKSHTPYFVQFGGHTSCPPEDGTVWVDNQQIALVDTATGGTAPTQELFNVPADEPAVFTVVLDNQTPVASLPDREYEVYIVDDTNDEGAVITFNGVNLNNTTYIDSLIAFDPDTILMTLERGSVNYDYTDVVIGIQPTCDLEGPKRFIKVSAYFTTPCSPVTIVTPDPNWVINGDDNFLQIGIQDYDPDNENLSEAILEYRRIGGGNAWTAVPILELGLPSIVDTTTLIAWNSTIAEGQVPTYYFDWTLPNDLDVYPDGTYEIRVKMDCGSSANISNAIQGTIAREGLYLFGNPEPADQIWTSGDEISFTFNKNLDCSLINQTFINENIFIVNLQSGDTLDFTLGCFNNKIIFILDQPMSNFDGKFLTMSVDNIPATTGNVSQKESWTFRVVTQTIYWGDADTIKVRIYKDEVASLNLRLENTTLNITETVGLAPADGTLDSWLSISDPANTSSFTVSPSGRTIVVDLTANLPLGLYNEQIDVTGITGGTPSVNIQLEVLNRPPDWVVDPGEFSSSMNLIANWKFTDEEEGAMSQDTVDLISVWAGGEIRGVTNISKSGTNFHAAYLTVFGKEDDPSPLPLEFRIWDADTGIEYDGYPTSNVIFIENGNVGTTDNPEILNVDMSSDRARYIPLKNGWTGFSYNTLTDDMSIIHKFRTLSNAVAGDIIKTSDAFAIYSETEGWFNIGENDLEDVSTNTGYMIYLQNGPDTLRVSGATPSSDDIALNDGWNWIGFPFENSETIDDAFDITNATGNDIIKSDFPLPDSFPVFSQYDLVLDKWNGSLMEMHSNQLHKIYLDHPDGGILSWTGVNNINGNLPSSNRSFNAASDPSDQSTWIMNDFNSDRVMPVVAEIFLDSILDIDLNDRIAFFKNDTLYGVSNIIDASTIGRLVISGLIEGIDSTYEILLFDSSEDQIYVSTQSISFQEMGYGTFENPFRIDFKACLRDLILTVDDSPLSGIYEASETITIIGEVNVLNGAMVELKAPLVKVIDKVNAFPASQVIIRPDGCQ